MPSEKAIRIETPGDIPPDLLKPIALIDSYIRSLKFDCDQEEKQLSRYRRMARTRIENAIKTEERKVVICKQKGEIIKKKEVEMLRIVCDHCSHKFVLHTNNSKLIFSQCPRCRLNASIHK